MSNRRPLPKESKRDAVPKTQADLNTWMRKRVFIALTLLTITFGLTAFSSASQRWYRTIDAEEQILSIAEEIHVSRTKDETVASIADRIVVAHYGASTPENNRARQRFHNLVVAVADAEDNPASNVAPAACLVFKSWCEEKRNPLVKGLLLQSMGHLVLQLFFLAFFFVVFGAVFIRARNELESDSIYAFEEQAFPSLEDEFRFRRNIRLLRDESRWLQFIVRHAAFASFIGQATLYFFAPLGLLASALEIFVRFKPLPGMISNPPIYSSTVETPSVVVGLSGYFLYSAVLILRQYISRDLSSRVMLSLVNRGIIVFILSSIVGSLFKDNMIAVVFLIGIFPQTGIDAIARIAQTSVEKFVDDTGTGLAKIPELDLAKQKILNDEGVYNVHDLAHAPIEQLLENVGIAPRVLMNAMDRAILASVMGFKFADKMETYPIFTATEFVRLVRPQNSSKIDEERMREIAATIQVKNLASVLASIEQNANLKIIIALNNKYQKRDTSLEMIAEPVAA